MNRRQFMQSVGAMSVASMMGPQVLVDSAVGADRVLEYCNDIDARLLSVAKKPDGVRVIEDEAFLDHVEWWVREQGYQPVSHKIRNLGLCTLYDNEHREYRVERHWITVYCRKMTGSKA